MIKTKNFELAIYEKGNPNSKIVAIVIPGRLDTKDYVHNTRLVDDLGNAGYYALSFDPPGTWESPGGLEIYSTTNYLKAIDELIEYFGNKPTILLGHSRGGGVAILSSANTSVISIVAIMASYGAPSAPSLEAQANGFEVECREIPPGNKKSNEQKKFMLPINYFTDGQHYYPEAVLVKCIKPKLLIYSDEDRFTKPTAVEKIYNLIPEPKRIYKVNSEHDYRYHEDIISEINNVIIKFLSKFIN